MAGEQIRISNAFDRSRPRPDTIVMMMVPMIMMNVVG
jgi:hypothetical protein